MAGNDRADREVVRRGTVTLVDARMTADVGGVRTNRVKVRAKRRTPAPAPAPRAKRPSEMGKGFYKKDGTLDGGGTVQVCVSFLRELLDEIDKVAVRAQVSRSAFFRQAYKHFDADHPTPLPAKRSRATHLSIPPRELLEIDRLAKLHGMDRSRFLMHAALYFCGKIYPEGRLR